MKCSKCLIDDAIFGIYTEGGNKYNYCKLCDAAIDRLDVSGKHYLFSLENFGNLDISKVDKDMINARIRRSKNRSPWLDVK